MITLLLAVHPIVPIGIVLGLGAGATAVYGWMQGWWNGGDDPIPAPEPTPPGPSPSPSPSPSPAPSPTPDDYAKGDPPNISGDAAGYDTDLFPSMSAVRQWLNNIGYSVEAVGPNAEKLLKSNGEVKDFQRDYNLVANEGAFLNEKYGMTLEFIAGADRYGTLTADGTISTAWPPTKGKNTLNALAIVAALVDDWGEGWQSIVAKAKGA